MVWLSPVNGVLGYIKPGQSARLFLFSIMKFFDCRFVLIFPINK
ncbi:hypothetical protein CSC04_3790 [Enterobacter roggenkampii]|nr:hypothetical protein CSC04_3790 [Enterobacter roggenkampii]